MFTIRGCSPKRVRYVHADMCLKYNVRIFNLNCFVLAKGLIRWQSHFPQVFFILYFVIFFIEVHVHVFLIVYHSSSTHSSKLTSPISLTFDSLISLN